MADFCEERLNMFSAPKSKAPVAEFDVPIFRVVVFRGGKLVSTSYSIMVFQILLRGLLQHLVASNMGGCQNYGPFLDP